MLRTLKDYSNNDGVAMTFEEPFLKKESSVAIEKAKEARRAYFTKSLMEYGFTAEQAELLVQSLDEFVEEEKDLTEEDKDALYKE
jgi:hypothetical protein